MNQQLCHISVGDQLSFVINTGVDIRMLSRKLLSLVIVFIMLLGLLFPASASNIAQNAENTELHQPGNGVSQYEGTNDYSGADVHSVTTDTSKMNSIRVPLNFDGSMPEVSQVEVNNRSVGAVPIVQSLSTHEEDSAGNAPKKVETDLVPLQDGLPDDIKLITADRYFKITKRNGGTERQFFAAFNSDISEVCSVIYISTVVLRAGTFRHLQKSQWRTLK